MPRPDEHPELTTASDPSLREDALAFARRMSELGSADPRALDELFARLGVAFTHNEHALFRDCVTALADALDGGIDLGQDEIYCDVLATPLSELTSRLLVSVYVTTPEADRPAAIDEAIASVRAIDTVDEPLRGLEETAVTPLEGFDSFLHAWVHHLESSAARTPDEDAWAFGRRLREATARARGNDGLAMLARKSRRRGDFELWVRGLVAAGDMEAAARAAREAATLVTHAVGTMEGSEQATLFTVAARVELARGNDPAPDLRRALLLEPRPSRLVRFLAVVPQAARREALRELAPAFGEGAVGVMVAALRGEWSRVGACLDTESRRSVRHHDGARGYAMDAVVWALSPALLTREEGSSSDLDSIEGRIAYFEAEIARSHGFAELPEPTFVELLTEESPARPTETQAAKLSRAVALAALEDLALIANLSRHQHYEGAAERVAIAASLLARFEHTSNAQTLVETARACASRDPKLAEAVERAYARTLMS
jgi:hypothetical protein